jgi:hypothetical protein
VNVRASSLLTVKAPDKPPPVPSQRTRDAAVSKNGHHFT